MSDLYMEKTELKVTKSHFQDRELRCEASKEKEKGWGGGGVCC